MKKVKGKHRTPLAKREAHTQNSELRTPNSGIPDYFYPSPQSPVSQTANTPSQIRFTPILKATDFHTLDRVNAIASPAPA